MLHLLQTVVDVVDDAARYDWRYVDQAAELVLENDCEGYWMVRGRTPRPLRMDEQRWLVVGDDEWCDELWVELRNDRLELRTYSYDRVTDGITGSHTVMTLPPAQAYGWKAAMSIARYQREMDALAGEDHGPGCDGPLNCTCEPF